MQFRQYWLGGGTVFADSASKNIDINLTLNSAISITTSKDTISLNTDPTPTGAFIYDYTDITVSTNNATGYKLSMSTDHSTLDNKLVLKNGVDQYDSSKVINSLASSQSVRKDSYDAFTKNTWGYALASELKTDSSTTFNAVPTGSVELKKGDAPTTGEVTSLMFGAKVDSTLTAGVYAGQVTFTATTDFVD